MFNKVVLGIKKKKEKKESGRAPILQILIDIAGKPKIQRRF